MEGLLFIICVVQLLLIIRLFRKNRGFKDKPAAIRIGKLEADLKIKSHTISNLESEVRKKERENENYYQEIQRMKDDRLSELERIKNSHEVKIDKVKEQCKEKIDRMGNKISAMSIQHTKEINKHKEKFIKDNNDIVEEVALKLAREKSKERIAAIEAKYDVVIKEMKNDFAEQIEKLEENFITQHTEIIEERAKQLSKEYIQENFPLE